MRHEKLAANLLLQLRLFLPSFPFLLTRVSNSSHGSSGDSCFRIARTFALTMSWAAAFAVAPASRAAALRRAACCFASLSGRKPSRYSALFTKESLSRDDGRAARREMLEVLRIK